MVKKFELIKENTNYALIDTEDETLRIQIVDLRIESKDIFDKLLIKAVDDKSFRFEISTSLTEKEDKRIFDQVKMLFSKIEACLNEIDSTKEETNS